ncbi:ABC transporter permease [Natronosalvus caseinilyticus]|uniref:ABC transporter permease n=1 Tax=Natronosalvus caseinilyticus TaxID=2953747 RepID=UPI0028AEA271|nr:ABC transporter permease [Natronosalvus caseinilyticus]
MATDTTTSDALEVTSIDWEEYDQGRFRLDRRTIGTYGSLLLVGLLWLYDYFYISERLPIVDADLGLFDLSLNPNNVDWLFLMTLVAVFWFVGAPLWENKRMTMYYWKKFRQNTAAVLSLYFLTGIFLVGALGPRIIGQPEPDWGNLLAPPVFFGGTWTHPFGTHRTGEDILEIVVAGAEVSFQVGLIATLFSVVLAAIVGATAAFMGGWADALLMRFVDLLMTFPTFFLIILLIYIYGGSLFLLIVILAFTGWGGTARLIRSEALQRSEEEYISAAEAAGASRAYIIRRHILPNVSNTIITAATLLIPGMILTEAVIAFLGFGDPDVWSWGRIIAAGRGNLGDAWWIATIPGIFLFFTVLSFNFLGDALRDALDPRHETEQ